MADQAFALSPMTATASLPTQADYDAIAGAFMETARGRWFLAEYARRNRNADTTMVLEAVARIEKTLAEQKQQSAPAPQSNDARDLIAAVNAILAGARTAAESAFGNPAMADAMAPARKCAIVIREIAWGLRESGADSRICGLLDAQVEAINKACDGFSADDLRGGVLGAFDRATKEIGELAKDAPPARKPDAAPVKPVSTVVRLETAQPVQPAPQPVAKPPAPAAKTIEETALHASIGGSLGASLLVSGVVAKPVKPKADPLAPIRRMTSAEKIAFFS
ncbi:MAG: hypothetical protein J0I29_11780 [Rhizobiales bacterium]|nr:hypothetical protein [Hyphomicrobiales bacterium]